MNMALNVMFKIKLCKYFQIFLIATLVYLGSVLGKFAAGIIYKVIESHFTFCEYFLRTN